MITGIRSASLRLHAITPFPRVTIITITASRDGDYSYPYYGGHHGLHFGFFDTAVTTVVVISVVGISAADTLADIMADITGDTIKDSAQTERRPGKVAG